MSGDLDIDGRVLIPAADLEWSAVRSSGPGGQNVNKVSTKVDLRFDVERTQALSEAVKARLRALPGARFDATGRVVITSSATRDQSRNLEDARAKLADLVRAALVEPKRRRKTRPSAGARRRRLAGKRLRAETKSTRGRVRVPD